MSRKNAIQSHGFYPLLPPYMDSPANHQDAKGTTKGTAVFILKCIFAGTRFDEGYELNTVFCDGLHKTIERFQNAQEPAIDMNGNFGQDTQNSFNKHFNIDLEKIPWSLLRNPDIALQPDGELLMWPPASGIILPNSKLKTTNGFYKLLPTYLDWPDAHTDPVGATSGPSVFIVKCLFSGTQWLQHYYLNTIFCDELAETIIKFQKEKGTDGDGCFGQDTRGLLEEVIGRNLEEIPRSVLTEADTAIQPDGTVISWPPQIVLS